MEDLIFIDDLKKYIETIQAYISQTERIEISSSFEAMPAPDSDLQLTAKQQRQQEKQQRRKKYADLAIQGTNNSSIASKRSVEILYSKHFETNRDIDVSKPNREYFKYFVPKPPKRSPCINRGYWLRLHAIRSRLDSIANTTSKNILVVNLGCGFDPLPFQLLDVENYGSRSYNKRFSFLDIDYADLIKRKTDMIRKDSALMKIVGPETGGDATTFISQQYKVASCNLNHPHSFRELLQEEGLNDPNTIKVFIAEVSLAYMKPDHADKIISLCSEMPLSHFLILEQLIPVGEHEPFSKRMLKHFTKNDSPLLSVLQYRTKESQRQRFSGLGFPSINVGDMYQLWLSVEPNTRSLIEEIEPFDELEEFQLFSHHYIILDAANYEYKFKDMLINPCELQPLLSMHAHFEKITHSIDRKFGSSLFDVHNNDILYFGGCNPSRINETITIDPQNGEKTLLNAVNSPMARMCHTLTASAYGKIFTLVGGRRGPNQGFSDTWFFNRELNDWKQGPSLPSARFRHCANFINDYQLLIFGGKTADSQFLIFDVNLQQMKECKVKNNELATGTPLISSAMDYSIPNSKGVILGGSTDGTNVSDKLYVFTSNGREIFIQKKITHPLLKRYGSKVLFLNEDEILIAGGTSPNLLFGKSTTIITLNLKTEIIREVPIPDNIWEDYPLFMVGFEMLQLPNNEILIIGGGATCYGFGSVSNKGFKIRL